MALYLTVQEITALVARHLASGDERRRAWEASNASDREVCARQACDLFDAVRWTGRRASRSQDGEWPRVELTGFGVSMLRVEAPPFGEWSVANLPGPFRVAVAIQAARQAVRGGAFDPTRQLLDAAHVGVVSKGSGGGSVSIDGARARSPEAALDPDAHRLVARLIARGWEAR